MIIVAKYECKCPHCGLQIKIGHKIDWHKGEKAIHVECLRRIEMAEKKAIQHDYPKSWCKQPGVDYPEPAKKCRIKQKTTPPLVDDLLNF